MNYLPLKLIVLGLCLSVNSLAKLVNVADFGARPDDGLDDTEALRRAAAFCRSHAGTTLQLSPGRYQLRDAEAVDTERRAISGALGRGLEVQWALFNPQRPYVTGLDFTGCRNVTIEASGAVLEVEGWMQVISLVHTSNMTLDGLTITMKRPAATEAVITAVSDSTYDLRFDPALYQYIDSVVQGRYYFYSQTRKTFYYGNVGGTTLLKPGLVRVQSKWHPAVGDVCIIRYGGHYRPCIMLKESRDVTLHNVSILSYPGMGVVGHLTENILVDGLKVVPESGRFSSTNTDATHFTSCSGTLTLRNCTFKGNGDDCTNVHNYYWYPYPQQNDSRQVEVRVEGADLHAQSLDYPQRGDTLQAVDRKSMAVTGHYVVRRVETSESDWKVLVTLDHPLAEKAEKVYLVNHTRFPKVFVENNTVYYHNGRAFLIKAPWSVLKDNRIEGTTLTAIKLGGELSWHEGVPVEYALIENNYIAHCGESGGDGTASCVMVTTEARETPPYVNRNITIRNNIFDSPKPICILLHDAERVNISHNIGLRPDGVKQVHSQGVTIQ